MAWIDTPDPPSRRAPNSADMRAALAALYYSAGRSAEAEEAWDQACGRSVVGWVLQVQVQVEPGLKAFGILLKHVLKLICDEPLSNVCFQLAALTLQRGVRQIQRPGLREAHPAVAASDGAQTGGLPQAQARFRQRSQVEPVSASSFDVIGHSLVSWRFE